MAASHAVVTGLVCWRREGLRPGRVAWPRAEVAEPLGQKLDPRSSRRCTVLGVMPSNSAASAWVRELLREAYWALNAQQEHDAEASWPISYGFGVKRRAK
jgi:hypothetical protein